MRGRAGRPGAAQEAGIVDGLVRVAVGIEHTDDLLEDFTRVRAPALAG